MMASFRKYGTCFFEQYAKISLTEILGSYFGDLENRDRPDLQSADRKSLGIEVTRAMDQSKEAAASLLKEMSGIRPRNDDEEDDMARIVENGYGFGLQQGRYIGSRELPYWSMALPLKRILQSKVSKAGNGFYGVFDRLGLYVFCKDDLTDEKVRKTVRYVMDLQKYQDIRYNRLYLSEVSTLYVCNLDDGLSPDTRIMRFPILPEQRTEFYLRALRKQF